MRIMDLNFQTALKYAFLGDEIYRLSGGSGVTVKVTDSYSKSVSQPRLIRSDGFTVILAGDDVLATDWVAESTDRSV